jgi:hypothetical protein
MEAIVTNLMSLGKSHPLGPAPIRVYHEMIGLLPQVKLSLYIFAVPGNMRATDGKVLKDEVGSYRNLSLPGIQPDLSCINLDSLSHF